MRTTSVPSLVETLEHRRLLSASLSHGVLVVNGTHHSDVITITKEHNRAVLDVTIDGKLRHFKESKVNHISVFADPRQPSIHKHTAAAAPALMHANTTAGTVAKHDTITIDPSVTESTDVHAGANSDDTLIGSGNNDTLIGGGGQDVLISRGAGDVVEGQSGHDELVFKSGQELTLADVPEPAKTGLQTLVDNAVKAANLPANVAAAVTITKVEHWFKDNIELYGTQVRIGENDLNFAVNAADGTPVVLDDVLLDGGQADTLKFADMPQAVQDAVKSRPDFNELTINDGEHQIWNVGKDSAGNDMFVYGVSVSKGDNDFEIVLDQMGQPLTGFGST